MPLNPTTSTVPTAGAELELTRDSQSIFVRVTDQYKKVRSETDIPDVACVSAAGVFTEREESVPLEDLGAQKLSRQQEAAKAGGVVLHTF